MNVEEIKIGDYIEGIEQWGNPGIPEYGIEPTLSTHKMRLVVKSITKEPDGNINFYGVADDHWGGARGTVISTKHGGIRVITDEAPFAIKWWKEKYKRAEEHNQAWRRDWKAFDKVRHFKGTEYLIIGLGKDTETGREVVIYKKADGTGEVWVRPRDMFEGPVDKIKYPNALQDWRFELISSL